MILDSNKTKISIPQYFSVHQNAQNCFKKDFWLKIVHFFCQGKKKKTNEII